MGRCVSVTLTQRTYFERLRKFERCRLKCPSISCIRCEVGGPQAAIRRRAPGLDADAVSRWPFLSHGVGEDLEATRSSELSLRTGNTRQESAPGGAWGQAGPPPVCPASFSGRGRVYAFAVAYCCFAPGFWVVERESACDGRA